jgi:hypothetical protein
MRAPNGGSRRYRLAAVPIVAMLAIGLTGCAEDGAIVRGLSKYGHDVPDLGRSKWVPHDYHLPSPNLLPSDAEVRAAAADIASPANDVSDDDVWTLIDNMCEAVDFVEGTSGSPDDAVTYALTRSKTVASYRLQAKELAEKLEDADSSGEQELILGRAMLCQTASQLA